MAAWYTKTKPGDLQGVVEDLDTGAVVAMCYDPAHAELVAQAPKMFELMRELKTWTVHQPTAAAKARDIVSFVEDYAADFKTVAEPSGSGLQDTDPMPFGKYRGVPMSEIPASYLHWLWANGKEHDSVCGVADYIRRNINVLAKEYSDGVW